MTMEAPVPADPLRFIPTWVEVAVALALGSPVRSARMAGTMAPERVGRLRRSTVRNVLMPTLPSSVALSAALLSSSNQI